MTETSLTDDIIAAIQEKKGRDVAVIDLRGIEGAVAAYFIICTGNSPTQVEAVAGEIYDRVLAGRKEKPVHVVGLENAIWVAIDYSDVMVHVFTPDTRSFYDLESLWSDAPIERLPDMD